MTELVPHNPKWKDMFASEQLRLASVLNDFGDVRIHHVGSTSLPDIVGKDIINILIDIEEDTDLEKFKAAIIGLGYNFWDRSHISIHLPPRIGFKKPSDKGISAINIRVAYKQSEKHPELAFRDFLFNNESVRKEYEQVKIRVAETAQDAYQYKRAKGDFVREILERAKKSL